MTDWLGGKALEFYSSDGWCCEFDSNWMQLYFLLILKPIDVNFVQKCQKCQICVIWNKLDWLSLRDFFNIVKVQ